MPVFCVTTTINIQKRSTY